MTKVSKKNLKCIKCGTESEQTIVYSVNFNLGNKEDNEKLITHQQVCPSCNYKALNISLGGKMQKEDFVFNEKYNYYEKELDTLNIIIEQENINKETVLEYAKYIVDNYLVNKKEIEKHLLDKRLREFYGSNNSELEIIAKIGKPSAKVCENFCQLMWFDSKLDEHLITLEINNEYKLSYVSIDG